jgi:crossover junction endodeoxyribonuclease RuvC
LEKPSKIILGIDPGTLLMGYCVIHIYGSRLHMHEMDVLKLNPKHDNYTRLQVIYKKVEDLINTFNPHYFAIEAPFFGKNVQSMLKLGRAQGVAIAAAIGSGVEVCEYSPRKVKQSITGNGNADKDQVWKMLQQIMMIKELPLKYYDASDALAVAVCHHFQASALTSDNRGKSKSWKQFVNANPERVKAK